MGIFKKNLKLDEIYVYDLNDDDPLQHCTKRDISNGFFELTGKTKLHSHKFGFFVLLVQVSITEKGIKYYEIRKKLLDIRKVENLILKIKKLNVNISEKESLEAELAKLNGEIQNGNRHLHN